ncbi:MAG: hypothetical protein ACI9NT_001424 [Bacteroidia bacterium]|jgi:hypothetical protein
MASDSENHLASVNRFIALANQLKEEGLEPNVVGGALMTAAGVFASFVAGGNEGGLNESGVAKVTAVFKKELERVEQVKKDGKELA